jgi:hypothetical protein
MDIVGRETESLIHVHAHAQHLSTSMRILLPLS